MLNRLELPIVVEEKHLSIAFPLACMHYTQQYRQEATLHHHDCMEIGHCVSGNGLMFIDGMIYPFAGGTVSLIPKGCIHDSRIIMSSPEDTPSIWRFLFVDMQKLGVPVENPSGFVTGSRKILKLFDFAFSACEEQPAQWQEETVHLLHALTIEAKRVEALPIVETENPYWEQMLLAQHKIALEYDSSLTVEGLAHFCNLSVSCFRKHFTQVVGMSPQQYILHVRLSVAEHLLRNTNEKIINISQKVGFGTISSFNRLFLKRYGYTPSAIRRR